MNRLRYITITALWLFLSIAVQGQVVKEKDNRAIDSATIANADWHHHEEEGIRIGYSEFDHLFGAPQIVFVLEIPHDEIHRLRYAYDRELTEVSLQAKKYNALAAVNGSFFDMVLGNPVCYLRIEGEEVGINTAPKNGDTTQRKYYQYATLCLDGDSMAFVVPDADRFHERTLPYPDVMTAGPMLIIDSGIVMQRNDRNFITNRHNRTAVGQRADGTVVIVVVDGRHKGHAEGMSIPQLSQMMLWMGCRNAINLDGGGSTTFYFDSDAFDNKDGVMNYPSDNATFDHGGERFVSSILYVK